MIRVYPCYWPVPTWLQRVEADTPYSFRFSSPLTFVWKRGGKYHVWAPVLTTLMTFGPRLGQQEVRNAKITGGVAGVHLHTGPSLRL